MPQHQTNVLVVGAGPVGMFAALRLANEGIHTQIIDEESGTAGHSYACALHPRTLRLLDEVGLAQEAIRHGTRIDTVALYGGGERRMELKLSDLPTRFPFVLVLDQSRLEELLQEELGKRGVVINWHHRLAGLVPDPAGVGAKIAKLAPTAKGYIVPEFELAVERELDTQVKFVIGADGQNSMVRRQLGLNLEPAGERELYVVYEFESDDKHEHEMRIVFDRATTSVMWPFSTNRCRWSFQIVPADSPSEFPTKDRSHIVVHHTGRDAQSLHRLQRLLRERAPWFGRTINSLNWSADIQFEHRLVHEFGRGRCWLAGDAAHQTGPVGMQSMNAGVHEASDLAAALTLILHEGASPEVLQEYDRKHRDEWQRLLGLKGSPEPTDHANTWAKGNCARIPACLPASGDDLFALVEQMGFEWGASCG